MATYAGQARDLRPWLTDAQINTDRNLRLEYLAGMANNVYDAQIYQDMLVFRRFPEEMFTASPEWMERHAEGDGGRAWFPVAPVGVGCQVSGVRCQGSGVVLRPIRIRDREWRRGVAESAETATFTRRMKRVRPTLT